jgi:hypothetical protein
MTQLRFFYSLLTLLCAITFVSDASAQAKVQRGRVTFTMIAVADLPYENLYYRDGQKVIPIELRKGRRSEPYTLSSAEFIELLTDHEDPELRYRLIGKAPLVTGTSQMLYFLKEKGSIQPNAVPVGMFGIDDSEGTFPDSSYRFINFINAPLSIEFNKEPFEMKPGQSVVRKLNLTEAGSFTPFLVKDLQGKVLGGTRLFSHAASRKMVLIFPPKQGAKRLDIRYFSD